MRLISVMPGFGMPIVASYISDDVRQEAYNRFKEAIEHFIAENCDSPLDYTIKTGKHWQEIIKAAAQAATSGGSDLARVLAMCRV